MNVLVIGSGGREHALSLKLKESSCVVNVFVAPGNAGTAMDATNVDIEPNDFAAIEKFCAREAIDMVVVGPEEPLVNGIADYFAAQPTLRQTLLVGPSAAAARLEGSKAFSKAFMQRYNIPTAAYKEFTAIQVEEGLQYLQSHPLPVVLKADGLAAGKGVSVCHTTEEASSVFTQMLMHRQFGKASEKVVVEAFLKGIEVSVFVLTDGRNYKIIGHAKDYKTIGEGNTGANTGGMGCVSPVPFVTDAFLKKTEEKIIRPTLSGIAAEGMDYKGFIFFGLMKVEDEPYLIEYNCRLGDPETEVILPRLENDLTDLLSSVFNNTLLQQTIVFRSGYFATIMAVSGGYPFAYDKGKKITFQEAAGSSSRVFHAGTKKSGADVVTNGGRVLAVTSGAESLQGAVRASLERLSKISFDGMYYRSDIGFEFPDS